MAPPPIKHKALINVDLGEAVRQGGSKRGLRLTSLQYGNYVCGPDLELLPMIDHANVACGFHAG
jgi:lactam utilization protein B